MGPLIRAMFRNKLRVGLLVAEIAFTLAIVLNCFGLLSDQLAIIRRDSGIDEANLIAVELLPWGEDYQDEEFRRSTVRRDLEALRAVPGVVDASALSPFPLQGGGSSTQLKPLGADDSARVRAPVYRADDHVLATLGLELVAGRDFVPADVPDHSDAAIFNVLVTQDLADALFPNGDALGKSLDTGSEEYPDVIVGIVRRMHTPYGGGPMESRILIYPRPRSRASFQSYLVRTEPGQLDSLLRTVEETVLQTEDRRVVTALPLMDYKARGYAGERLLIGVLSTVIGLLLAVAALGLFGMTSFAVTQRTREIGTRRALGASSRSIVMQFLTESVVVLAMGTGIGLVAAVALNTALVSLMDASTLSGGMAVAGVVILWTIGMVATLSPAVRASRLAPVLATRSV
jgi:putative ABC transport system permease protein